MVSRSMTVKRSLTHRVYMPISHRACFCRGTVTATLPVDAVSVTVAEGEATALMTRTPRELAGTSHEVAGSPGTPHPLIAQTSNLLLALVFRFRSV